MTVSPTCVLCGGALRPQYASHVVCATCGHGFPVTHGIIDLRPPELVTAEDLPPAALEELLAAYPRQRYADLVALRFRLAAAATDAPDHLVEVYRDYTLGQAERGRQMTEMFRRRLRDHFPGGGSAAALDLGCGSGASLLALAASFGQAVGVDPSLANLLLARKAAEEAGLSNITLVRGYGQRLPFAAGGFDYVNAQNVLEHVFTVDPVLAEVRRVLRPGGGFAADSRNRYDLFLPEPHAKVRWVGLLPRPLMRPYVRWRTGLDYSATYLLSYGQLRRSLRRHFGRSARVAFPYVSAYGYGRGGDRLVRLIERVPLLRGLAIRVFPSHLALARAEG